MTESPVTDLDLGVVGNCSFSALINRRAEIVWACMPRFDSEPVFCSLLQDNAPDIPVSAFAIDLIDFHHSDQQYIRNTAVLVTTLHDKHGNSLEVIDFAPRFKQFGRTFHPIVLVRKIRPLEGAPRIRIRLRPTCGIGKHGLSCYEGSNHISYNGGGLSVRLTTNASITAIKDERPFILNRPLALIFGPDEAPRESVAEVADNYFSKTLHYWRDWSRYLAIPFEWQDAVIRAAITLKLSAYEDTGAIIAAPTTSIPEAPNTERNWDYRYCWLRDAYFTVQALNRLGATQTMERHLEFILNLVAAADNGQLQPVYCVNGEPEMDEYIVEHLPGYRGMGPVRIGNQAYQQIQHDVYGSVVMAATQIFFDKRIFKPGDENLFKRLEVLGETAILMHDQPDAGLWELRGSSHIHTFSSAMCWAACKRLARIAYHLGLAERGDYWCNAAENIREVILQRGWSARLNSFVSTFEGQDMDASLLLLPELGFVDARDPRMLGTVAQIEKQLKRGRYIFRYVVPDDFGEPENAFTICSFWYIDTIAAQGRLDEARELFNELLARRNSLGLLAEDLDIRTGELWGNYPQTYSMVGIINSAMRLSKRWEEAL